ncbi:MAG: choice-of-anchor tandem repeat GloVer-containing protein [Candidatus Korobacteraceae bacterium]
MQHGQKWGMVRTFVLLVLGLTTTLTQAQPFTVLHSFTGGQDGSNPLAGVSMDRGGNLYGTASVGGLGYGTVFQLAHRGSNWLLNPIYQFQGGSDGYYPEAGITIAADGTLYGTTFYGGISTAACLQGAVQTCGTVFHLRPPASACKAALCPWAENLIYEFTGTFPSLFFPNLGNLVFDRAGNMYGAILGGFPGGVYELSPSGGGWSESLLHVFQGTNAGLFGGVILDSAGSLYGTTRGSLSLPGVYGTVYQLTNSGSGWTANTLYTFQGGSDGAWSVTSLLMDPIGNLYGTTSSGGSGGGGTVFELTPSQGGWVFNLIYSFTGPNYVGSFGGLTMDAAGNLYGTTLGGGAFQQGSVFKLTHSNGTWTYTALHDFTAGNDGRSPYGQLIFDAAGNLYGTAGWGGSNGKGLVWEITP